MKTLLSVLLLSVLASVSAFAGEFTGYVSDTKCAAANGKKGAAAEWVVPAAFEACAKKCIEEGSQMVFVTADNKIVKISPEAMPRVMPMLGRKVTLTGEISGDTLTKVDAIASVKM